MHRYVGVSGVVTSGNLGGVMVCKLAQNAKDVGLILALGAIFPICVTFRTLTSHDQEPVKATNCTDVEPTRHM